MFSKRIIYTVATAALGLSLVGVANADTLGNMKPLMAPSAVESTSNMPTKEMNTNMQNMPSSSENIEQPKVEVKISNDTAEDNQDTIRMNLDNMENFNEVHNQMYETHENNFEAMNEIHNNMPMNESHMEFEEKSADESTGDTYRMESHMNSNGMNRHMMGR